MEAIKTTDIICPASVGIVGNIDIRISDINKRLINSANIHNNCTPSGILYILNCLLEEYLPTVTNFGITTFKRDEQGQFDTSKPYEHIFSTDSNNEDDKGYLIRDIIQTTDGRYRARFKFYLSAKQLLDEQLYQIHLYMRDGNGNLFKAFSAQHVTIDGAYILKDNTITVSYEWVIGLRNENEGN